VCATDSGPEPKPLILEVSPGALGEIAKCVARTEEMAGWAVKHGKSCVALRPTGRGNGSVYQHYGEVDLFEAIDHVRAHYLLAERGYEYKYTEVPGTGHSCRSPELFEQVVLWLLDQKKDRFPNTVAHIAYTLRHNRSFGIAIEQLETYGARGAVQASLLGTPHGIKITTDNVRALSLSPPAFAAACTIEVDGVRFEQVSRNQAAMFHKDRQGQWRIGSFDWPHGKRHSVSGPIGDLFFGGVILVPGTTGSAQETHVTRDMARRTVQHYSSRNGGVHRGGKLGDNNVQLPVVDDVDLTDALRVGNNLILYGTASSNAVLAHLADQLPIAFGVASLHIGAASYAAEGCAAFAVFPHPENPERYVAVHGGTTPDAICWGSHFDMHLLPDYIVYARGELIDWGFFDNEWQVQA
jgi:hypothetical protein